MQMDTHEPATACSVMAMLACINTTKSIISDISESAAVAGESAGVAGEKPACFICIKRFEPAINACLVQSLGGVV
jgi:hypothetical protein